MWESRDLMTNTSVTATVPGRPDRVLLLGVARSGTRWLGTALSHTEGTRYVTEPDNVDADPRGAGPSKLGFGPYPVIDEDDEAPQFRGLWDLSFSARVPRGWGRDAARVGLRLPRPVRDPLLRRTAQAMSALPGRPPQVVVKSIYAMFAVDWLLKNHQPRVVVLQRNPLNVISSWAELGVHGFDLLTRRVVQERYLRPLGITPPGEDASVLQRTAAWVGLLTTVLAEQVERHPGWLVVTHEDLCREPQVRIREVCDRLGLPWSAAVERFLHEANRPGDGFSHVRITREQPNRWRGRLADDQVAEIEAVLNQFPSQGWVLPPSNVSAAATGAS